MTADNVKALVITGFGLNCEKETSAAFEMCGAKAYQVHLNDLLAGKDNINNYHILAFIGGFDQNNGFEQGNPKVIKEMVHKLFEAKSTGGYICSPSDHFFFGDPENIKAFVEAAKECVYR